MIGWGPGGGMPVPVPLQFPQRQRSRPVQTRDLKWRPLRGRSHRMGLRGVAHVSLGHQPCVPCFKVCPGMRLRGEGVEGWFQSTGKNGYWRLDCFASAILEMPRRYAPDTFGLS